MPQRLSLTENPQSRPQPQLLHLSCALLFQWSVYQTTIVLIGSMLTEGAGLGLRVPPLTSLGLIGPEFFYRARRITVFHLVWRSAKGF